MEHQDWEEVKLGNKNKTKQANKSVYTIENKMSDEQKSQAAKNYKLENSEDIKVETVPSALAKEIIQLRTQNKLNQKDFAQKLYVQHTQINDIESGKAIYNQDTKKVIKQIERTFKINFINK
jgi:ribosome-binding protein aMBF1 (putative translation factor)